MLRFLGPWNILKWNPHFGLFATHLLLTTGLYPESRATSLGDPNLRAKGIQDSLLFLHDLLHPDDCPAMPGVPWLMNRVTVAAANGWSSGFIISGVDGVDGVDIGVGRVFFPCAEYGDIVVFRAWFEGFTHCAWTYSWGHVLGMVQVRHISKLDESSKMLTLAVISSFVAYFGTVPFSYGFLRFCQSQELPNVTSCPVHICTNQ